MDKFYYLIRRVVHELYVFARKRGWDSEALAAVATVLAETVLDPEAKKGRGLTYHTLDVMWKELGEVSDGYQSVRRGPETALLSPRRRPACDPPQAARHNNTKQTEARHTARRATAIVCAPRGSTPHAGPVPPPSPVSTSPVAMALCVRHSKRSS